MISGTPDYNLLRRTLEEEFYTDATPSPGEALDDIPMASPVLELAGPDSSIGIMPQELMLLQTSTYISVSSEVAPVGNLELVPFQFPENLQSAQLSVIPPRVLIMVPSPPVIFGLWYPTSNNMINIWGWSGNTSVH